jgi:hypothetical protein
LIHAAIFTAGAAVANGFSQSPRHPERKSRDPAV